MIASAWWRNLVGTLACVMILGIASPGVAETPNTPTLNTLTSVQLVNNVPFDAQIAAARMLGVRRVRLAVRWYEVERSRGAMDWRSTDARVLAVKHAGMTPIIGLFGANGAYPAAADGSAWSDATIAGFARFSADTVARYGVSGPAGAIWYEIWNEPNTKTFWGRSPNPEAYATLAKHACTAIKAGSPTARVLGLSMEGWPVKEPYYVLAYNIDIYQQWAARAATPDLMQCVDGISMHPYLARPEMILEGEPRLKAFLAQHWSRPTPPRVVFSEVGNAISDRPGHILSPEQQAAYDLRDLLIGTGQGRITNLYMVLNDERDPAKIGQGYGLVSFDGRIRPSGAALQRMLRMIGDFEIAGLAPVPGQAQCYRFAARQGARQAQVLWCAGAAGQATVAPGTQSIDLVTGSERPVAKGAIVVNGMPVLLMPRG